MGAPAPVHLLEGILMKTLILGGHLIDPANGMDGQYNLLLEKGKILDSTHGRAVRT